MGRKKRFAERVGIILTTGMLDQIDACRGEGESRSDWIRGSIKKSLLDAAPNEAEALEWQGVTPKRQWSWDNLSDAQYARLRDENKSRYLQGSDGRWHLFRTDEDKPDEYQASQPHTG